MPYLLDSQVVSYFLQARREVALAAAAERIPCAIAEIVRDELAEDPTRGALFARWLPASHLAVVALEIGSPAEALWSRLQPRVTSKGRGERASIALAAANSDYVFAAWTRAGCGSRCASCGRRASACSPCRCSCAAWSMGTRSRAMPRTTS